MPFPSILTLKFKANVVSTVLYKTLPILLFKITTETNQFRQKREISQSRHLFISSFVIALDSIEVNCTITQSLKFLRYFYLFSTIFFVVLNKKN